MYKAFINYQMYNTMLSGFSYSTPQKNLILEPSFFILFILFIEASLGT